VVDSVIIREASAIIVVISEKKWQGYFADFLKKWQGITCYDASSNHVYNYPLFADMCNYPCFTCDSSKWLKFSFPCAIVTDQLNVALGNPEHIGHIRGVGSQMSCKHGFWKDSTSYKKRDRYKKTLEDKIEEKVNTLFENMFMTFIQNLSQHEGSPHSIS
jgi:hypothetical protein